MSSTNRGGKRSEADFYATPSWCVRRLLDAISAIATSDSFLEPCAGDGAIISAVTGRIGPREWTATELRSECETPLKYLFGFLGLTGEIRIEDFILQSGFREELKYDACITNPPFSLAMDFIRACLPISKHAIFLLRLNFLGSEERSSFIRERKPDLYVLPNRPSFMTFSEHKRGKLATDSIEYAWFHFHEHSRGRYVMLDSTPIEERRQG